MQQNAISESFKNIGAKLKLQEIGYNITLFGVVLLLLWIGITKFKPTEANAIVGYISNSFFMSWLYDVFSVETTAKLLGSVEITIAIGLIASLRSPLIGCVAALLGLMMFMVTLSFLFTTPNMWHIVDGILVTKFFILKDIASVGFCLIALGKNIARLTPSSQ